jgi:MFS family permease
MLISGLADNVASLVLLRSMVGVGEAAYVTIVPTMLSDFYPAWERPVVFGIYYLALPVGAAVGFGVGAMVGATYGWRVAFYLCGLPGIFASLSVLRVVDPERGINEPERVNDSEEEIISPLQMNSDDNDYAAGVSNEDSIPITHTLLSEFWEILTNKVFMCATLGLAANAFALGGLADWYATYLLRYCNVTLQSAGLVAGAATIVGGLLGNVMGCKIADHLDGRVKSSYLLVPALFCIPAALCNIWAVNSTNSTSAYLAIFLTQTFAWTQIGPLSTVSITSVKYRLRARSSGIQIMIQHFLGDVISPPIIGGISDSTGSLMTGLQTTWLALLVSGLCWGAGSILLLPISYARHDAEYKRTVTIREILSDAPTFTLKEADK